MNKGTREATILKCDADAAITRPETAGVCAPKLRHVLPEKKLIIQSNKSGLVAQCSSICLGRQMRMANLVIKN